MEHPINRSTDATENDPSLSVTALIVVAALIFIFYFAVRVAVPELPLLVHTALAAMPSASQLAANAVSMLP
jgi:hypothetical protein